MAGWLNLRMLVCSTVEEMNAVALVWQRHSTGIEVFSPPVHAPTVCELARWPCRHSHQLSVPCPPLIMTPLLPPPPSDGDRLTPPPPPAIVVKSCCSPQLCICLKLLAGLSSGPPTQQMSGKAQPTQLRSSRPPVWFFSGRGLTLSEGGCCGTPAYWCVCRNARGRTILTS